MVLPASYHTEPGLCSTGTSTARAGAVSAIGVGARWRAAKKLPRRRGHGWRTVRRLLRRTPAGRGGRGFERQGRRTGRTGKTYVDSTRRHGDRPTSKRHQREGVHAFWHLKRRQAADQTDEEDQALAAQQRTQSSADGSIPAVNASALASTGWTWHEGSRHGRSSSAIGKQNWNARFASTSSKVVLRTPFRALDRLHCLASSSGPSEETTVVLDEWVHDRVREAAVAFTSDRQ
jgi:hypothetical protein